MANAAFAGASDKGANSASIAGASDKGANSDSVAVYPKWVLAAFYWLIAFTVLIVPFLVVSAPVKAIARFKQAESEQIIAVQEAQRPFRRIQDDNVPIPNGEPATTIFKLQYKVAVFELVAFLGLSALGSSLIVWNRLADQKPNYRSVFASKPILVVEFFCVLLAVAQLLSFFATDRYFW